MSPEQASGRRGAVTTASDVYGLGAVLYALLTGRAPFVGESVMGTLDQVRDRAPESPLRHNRRVPRDLEVICLKCLEKDPERRYASAQALAEDLRQYLAGEPIAARPVGAAARAWMWCKRNPALAGLVAALILALVVGVAGITWEWRQAVANLKQAERNFALARDAVDRSYTQVSEDRLLNEPHMERLRKELLGTALEFYQRFVDERRGDPQARFDLGLAHHRLSVITRDTGSLDQALEYAEQMRAIFVELARIDPKNRRYQEELASSHDNLGKLFADSRRTQEAEAAYRKAVEIQEALVAERPQVLTDRIQLATYLNNLGNLDLGRKRIGQAKEAYGNAVKILEAPTAEHSGDESRYLRAVIHGNLGKLDFDAGRTPEAEQSYRQAVAILETLAAEHPEAVRYRRTLASDYQKLGGLLAGKRRWPEAKKAFQRVLTICDTLAEEHPGIPSFRVRLAESMINLGHFHYDRSEYAESEQASVRSVELLKPLVATYPDDLTYQDRLARADDNLSNVYGQTQRLDEAVQVRQQVIKLYSKLTAARPDAPDFQQNLAVSYDNLGRLSWLRGAYEASERANLSARDRLERLVAKHPDIPEFRSNLAASYLNMAYLYRDTRRPAEAWDVNRRGLELAQRLVEQDGDDFVFQQLLANHQLGLGIDDQMLGRLEQAEAALAQATSLWERLATNYPEEVLNTSDAGEAAEQMGNVLRRRGRWSEALDWYGRALATLEPFRRRKPLNPEAQRFLCESHEGRARAWSRLGDHQRAVAEVEVLTSQTPAPAGLWLDAAGVYACASGAALADPKRSPAERSARAEALGARAMDLLAKAHAAGSFRDPANRGKLLNDPELGSLRGRSEFQAMVLSVLDEAFPADPFVR
jgi:serine/threonine-protein kinase